MSGVDDPAEQIQLVRLSSLMGKEDLYLNYVALPKQASDQYDIEFVDSPILITKRWNPTDMFSAFHDDLLPIYSTLKYLCTKDDMTECLEDYVIAFEDENQVQIYDELFPNVMYLSKFINIFNENQLLCFQHATVGLESDSLWFNHGFDSLNGPVDNVNFRPHLLENFREFVIGKLTGADGKNKQQFDVVIFESDKFKNAHEIKTLLQHNFKLKVQTVNARSGAIGDLIQIVSNSKVLIAFVDPINILSLFLSRLSGILEIFPYGLDESSFPKVSSLAQKRGMFRKPQNGKYSLKKL